MRLTIEVWEETEGRFGAEVRGVPDAVSPLAYGETRDAAIAKAQALALRILADRLEAGLLAAAA
jgi:predicted RNase H-like HicB family nuclease